MKKLLLMPLTVLMLAVIVDTGEAGLLDELFETVTTKNPPVYGRVVSGPYMPREDVSRERVIPTAFRQPVQETLPPIPAGPAGDVPPAPEGEGAATPAAEPIKLYHRVKYSDLDNVHPCAVKMIVQVKDPCPPPVSCNCAQPAPRCVFVEICVPPCPCPKFECSHDGSHVEYDYGDYEVEVTSKRGVVYVDYDD